jgi:hypothetical protein
MNYTQEKQNKNKNQTLDLTRHPLLGRTILSQENVTADSLVANKEQDFKSSLESTFK